MSELLSCPFCGGEARFETYGGTACAVVCQTCGCGTPTMRLDDGMIAVDLWNRRAERTCKKRNHNTDDYYMRCYSCSRCNAGWFEDIYDKPFSYCPHCGAKVVG